MPIKRALASVFRKDGIVEFAKILNQEFGVRFLSTGGTASLLKRNGIEVESVSDYTGVSEMFEGRVKTLHPKIEGGILFRRNNEQDVEDARAHGIDGIDMVICNLYPFEDVIQKPSISLDDALEMIDIGGPTMIRAAAKNFKHVVVVSSPQYYDLIIKEMRENNGEVTIATRLKLAIDVFRKVSQYNASIYKFLEKQLETREKFPELLIKVFRKVHECRYGENWDQQAAFYRDLDSPYGIHSLKKLWGKEISFNNYLDIDSCFQILSDLNEHEYVSAIFKHTTPNGVAVDSKSQMNACLRAFSCDPLSAFGGIWGFNKPLEPDVARYLIDEKKVFIEVLLAPSFPQETIDILSKKDKMRVLTFNDILEKRELLYQNLELRGVLGGVLIEEYDYKSIIKKWDLKTSRPVSEQEKKELIFAMRVCKWAKSNSAVFVKGTGTGMYTIGIGAGQQSRVHVIKLAHSKAIEFKHDPTDSVMATDSFFPFPDGIEAAAEAGAIAVICPGGSIRDEIVIKRAEELGISLVFSGKRVFRH
ncbi:MAG: bifunctional phosphoribosylaminoimidazolecarboxamide formyltransferase/IMP cyclohydrolase [Promethearchaeota archaeon]